MADWARKLDAFLQFNERNILSHAGKVSHELAEEHAHRQFEQYDTQRRKLADQIPSDFDKAVDEVKRLDAESKPSKPRKKRKGGEK